MHKGIRAFAVALLASCAAAAALVLIAVQILGPLKPRPSGPTTPKEWEEGGYASFASDMAAVYEAYDGDLEPSPQVHLSVGKGILVSDEHAFRDVTVTEAPGGIRSEARGLLGSLGYTSAPDGDGFRATNERRGDEVLVLPDAVEVNGVVVDVGVAVDEGGAISIDVRRLAGSLGYEVLGTDGDDFMLQDPWEAARVVATGADGLDDPNALSVVDGPDGMVVLQYGTSLEAREAAERFVSDGDAVWAGPDRIMHLCDPDDGGDFEPAPALSWGNECIGSTDIQRALVRKYGSEGAIPEVVVAVIDTGVDMDHDFLAGRLVGGYDFVDDDDEPDATHMHGTHVSGIVVNNTTTNVKVMPVRASEGETLAETAIYSSIEYAASHGADVINMSFTGYYESNDEWLANLVHQQAIRDAEAAGSVMVAAHGNEALDTALAYPSSDPAVISVSALDEGGELASYSNYGQPVDLCAPGSNINSATLENGYEISSGTSMAAPFVSAAAALALSDEPGSASDTIRRRLQDGARDLGIEGWDKQYGWGCVDLSGPSDGDYAARIGTTGYASFQEAYQAAANGDTIILLRDIDLSSTFELGKDVTIRAARSQAIRAAGGATAPLLRVTGSVTLGDDAGAGRSLLVTAGDGGMIGSLVVVEEGGALSLIGDTTLSASSDTVIDVAGSFVARGITVRNGSEAGLCIHATGPVSLDDCTLATSRAEQVSIASTDQLSIDGSVVIGGCVQLLEGGFIQMGSSLDMGAAWVALAIDDPYDGRTVLAWQDEVMENVPPFYLTDTAWRLEESGGAYVLRGATAHEARIGDAMYATLSDALSDARAGDVVVICRDVIAAYTLDVSDGVGLAAEGDVRVMASPMLAGPLMRVGALGSVAIACDEGSSLTLDGLNRTRASSLVEVGEGASLELGAHVVVTGFRSSTEGVSPVRNEGTLTIDGARIAGNEARLGGGVYNLGTMELLSGEVRDNAAEHAGGGIYNEGTVEVSGGNVDDNRTTEVYGGGESGSGLNARGGGICNLGTLRVFSGSVSGNLSDDGGGIYSSGTLEVSGGMIAFNTARSVLVQGPKTTYSGAGGGVHTVGTFDMTGGEIRGNHALSRGGGVCVHGGTMTLAGGEIADNSTYNDVSNSTGGYYGGPGDPTFFVGCGIYASQGGRLRLAGGRVSSSKELSGQVLVSSNSGTEISGGFEMVGGMLWATSDGNDAFSGWNGLPLEVASELTGDAPIRVFSQSYPADTVVIEYAEGVDPDLSDFELGDFGPNPYMYAGGDTLRVEGRQLVLTRGQEVVASEGWERNGTCEQRIDSDGILTMRPINGIQGVPATSLQNRQDIVGVVFEDGVTVRDANYFLYGCANLETADLSGMRIIDSADCLFRGCVSLVEVTLPDTWEVTSVAGLFYGCESLEGVDLSPLEGLSLSSLASMFGGCSALRSIDLSAVDASCVESTNSMFSECFSLEHVDFSGFDTGSLADAGAMFFGCCSLTSIDLSGWDTSQLTSVASMFYTCEALESVDLSGWDTSQLESAREMFFLCRLLTDIDVSGWDVSSLGDTTDMFYLCESLESFPVSSVWPVDLPGAMPNPTAPNGRWMSTFDGGMYTLEEIMRDRRGIVDTYVNPYDAETRDVVAAIYELSIPQLTLADADRVAAVRSAYDALAEGQKALVFNADLLLTAEARIVQLREEAGETEGVGAVIEAILALPSLDELTVGDAPAVEAARAAYEALDEERRGLVWNLDVLEAAEVRLGDMWGDEEDAQHRVEAQAVDATIEALLVTDDITLDDGDAVDCARAAYDALDDGWKAYAWRYPELTDIEGRIAELRAAEDVRLAAASEAAAVDNAIAALPEVEALALSDAPYVFAARAAYVALEGDVQALVVQVATLETAEARMTELLAAAGDGEADAAAASTVDAVIRGLPAVGALTVGDAAAVRRARLLYSTLPDDQQAAVSDTLLLLEAAEGRIAFLCAQPVTEAIADLPEPDALALSDRPAVVAARASYDALDEAAKALVDGYAVLTAAESRIEELEWDVGLARPVVHDIAELPVAPQVTLDDRDSVEYARRCYEELTDVQRALVVNLPRLEAAEVRISSLLPDPNPTDISDAEIHDLVHVAYTGEPITQLASVTLGGVTLTEHEDYELSWIDNVDVGTATVTATGMGGYCGSVSATFLIMRVPQTIDAPVSVQLRAGNGTQLRAEASGGGELSFRSSDPSVCTVDELGYVSALRSGRALIVIEAAATRIHEAYRKCVAVTVVRAPSQLSATVREEVVYARAGIRREQRLASNVALADAAGKVSYSNASDGTAGRFRVAPSGGAVTVPAGTAAGTYELSIRVRDTGSEVYLSGTRTVTYQLVVR